MGDEGVDRDAYFLGDGEVEPELPPRPEPGLYAKDERRGGSEVLAIK